MGGAPYAMVSAEMTHGRLTSGGWRTLTEAQRLTFYDGLLEALPPTFVPERTVGLLPGEHPAMLHAATGLRFVVVLGGPAALGLTAQRLERAREALALRWYGDADVSGVGLPSPPPPEAPRLVEVAPFLVSDVPAPYGVWRRLGVTAPDLGVSSVPLARLGDVTRALAAHGLRLPTVDEWDFVTWFSLDANEPEALVREVHRRAASWDDARQRLVVTEHVPPYELPQRVPSEAVTSVAVWPAMSLALGPR